MNETKTRIISAAVLLCVFLISTVIFGKTGLLLLVGLMGVLCVDEVFINFLKKNRGSAFYFFAQLSFSVGYFYLNFTQEGKVFYPLILNTALILNAALLIYLFFDPMNKSLFKRLINSNSYIVGLFFLLPFASLSYIVLQAGWVKLVILLLILNFSVDIGAWFFGKKYGKKKLWPSISPNKTVNGTVGGVISSVVLGAILSIFFYGQASILLISTFVLVALSSQIGDLIQSKFKRQFSIKDSSRLIPGHGGVYDRLDSLLFMSPFYVIIAINILK